MKRLIALFALAVVALAPAGAGRAAAQERSRCFPETGYCVSGVILEYWERNGGLAVFGYPIGPLTPNELVEGTWAGPTQWFERDRLEDHGAEGVMAGRMGARYLELRWINWRDLPQAAGAPPGCAFFAETGHSLCEPFLGYWRRNGGLERFGFPLSEPQVETIDAWTGTVQYFERRRMEHHTELAGTRYEVLLGRLAAVARAMQPPATCDAPVPEQLAWAVDRVPFRQYLGCAADFYADVPASAQRTTGGMMVWVDLGAGGRHIFAAYRSSVRPGNPVVQQRFDDTWQEGVDPVDYMGPQPAGLYPLQRGFGKVWFRFFRRGPESPGVGVEPERPERAAVLRYSTGGTVLVLRGEGTAYAFGPQAEQYAAVPRP